MKYLLAILLVFAYCNSEAQVDFNNYKTVQAAGEIPADFTTQTYTKVAEGLDNGRDEIGNKATQRKFLEKTGYAIDELLHSGLVVYGDDMTNYVSSIADKLLSDNKVLREKLRFYTLNTNVTNAFSTDQGIIFVTSGLLSQLTSEAQLAFVLAHEIAHYTEKHIIETFIWKKSSDFKDDWIGRMSIYSKEKEFEADRFAVDMYKQAGYAKDEIVSTLDVLLYSYLPFDEVEISLDYFTTDMMFLHPMLFPETTYEIQADENEDDSNSSHPNIKKRKIAVETAINNTLGKWGEKVNPLGEKRFLEIRTIARFESVRTDIMNAEYGNVLYSIYLLEKEHPESIYLQRMKAQAWVGLYQYKKQKKISGILKKRSEYEGQSANVHFLLRKLNLKSLTTLALRQVYDIYQTNPEDEEIAAIYNFMIVQLGHDDKFDLKIYSSTTFQEAIYEMEKKKLDDVNTNETVDTTKVVGSKYDRIKKGTDRRASADQIDSMKYYLYGLSDVIKDNAFLKLLDKQEIDYVKTEKEKLTYADLSYKEQRKYNRIHRFDHLKIGTKGIMVVEPRVFHYSINGVDHVKSERLEERFAEAMNKSADLAEVELYMVDSRSIEKSGTLGFNQRTALISCLRQVGNETKIRPFPVDYSILKTLNEGTEASHAMFSIVQHTYAPDIGLMALLGSIYILPIAPMYLSSKFLSGNHTIISLVFLDLKTGSIVTAESFENSAGINRHNLGARMYSVFNYLKTQPQ